MTEGDRLNSATKGAAALALAVQRVSLVSSQRARPRCTLENPYSIRLGVRRATTAAEAMADLRITVYGGAPGEIGGNRILLKWDDGAWLLDFGTRK